MCQREEIRKMYKKTHTISWTVLYVGSTMAFLSVTSFWKLTIAAFTWPEFQIGIIAKPPFIYLF
jgi:hypothetical protein